MADRAVTRARHNSEGDVTAIGSPGAAWSPRLKVDAIRDIESGDHRYYVPWNDGVSTWIHVVDDPDGKYLRTSRDGTTRNNLDDLDEC